MALTIVRKRFLGEAVYELICEANVERNLIT